MSSSFWDEKYWLPRNTSWDEIPSSFYDLVYPIYFAIPILFFRILLESLFGISMGVLLGVVPRHELKPRIIEHLTGGFARYTRTKRVLECMFRCVSYSLLFFYGLFALWDKSWFADVIQCWVGYPYHQIETSVWWYYMIEIGFYYSLLIGSVFDVKRSDFWQLVFHHIITIFLLSASWTINFVRFGTLVLISHDVSDIILEGGKLVRYYGSPSYVTNSFFVVFLISWFITRLGYFPFVLIRSAFRDARGFIQPDYNVFNPFHNPHAPRFVMMVLFCLLILHIFWTVIIMKIVIRSIVVGEASDVRSDSEEDEKEKIAEKKKLVKTKKERDDATTTKKSL